MDASTHPPNGLYISLKAKGVFSQFVTSDEELASGRFEIRPRSTFILTNRENFLNHSETVTGRSKAPICSESSSFPLAV